MPWTATPPPDQRGLFRPFHVSLGEPAPAVRALYAALPQHPYAWDGEYVRILRRDHALDSTSIQADPPWRRSWIWADIDRALDWFELWGWEAVPHMVVRNRSTGHFHAGWRLARPVWRQQPQAWRWQASLAARLRHHVGSDPGYSGHLVRVPGRIGHDTWARRARGWTLRGLHARLPRATWRGAVQQELFPAYSGAGRNCHLFDSVRVEAYSAWRRGLSREALQDWCLERLHRGNIFPVPLGEAELSHTAKSIAHWTARHLMPGAAWHAEQGRRGGLASGKVRKRRAQPLADQAIALAAQELGYKRIAKTLSVSQGAVRRWLGRLPRGKDSSIQSTDLRH